MDFITSEKRRPILIGSIILLFMAVALALRMIPALFIPAGGFFQSSGADVWYTMRQIEVMVAHFPQYNWFDPMTAYPVGKTIDWGPFYPFLAAALSIILGASSRADIVNSAGWVAPLMAALMVPVTYHLGRIIGDWKTGLVAAGFVSVLSYAYFYMSSYGWVDHHTAETFFIALFFLAYLAALEYSRSHPVDRKNLKTLMMPVLFSCLSGILYFLGYITAPTVVIALLVVGIATFFLYLSDYTAGRPSEYLLLTNCISFFCIAVLVALFGFHGEGGLSLITYSEGHLFVMLGLIGETIILYGLVRIFCKNAVHYYLSLAVMVIGGGLLLQFLPSFQAIRAQAVGLVFGSSAYSIAIRETQPWTFSAAYETFNLALILMAGGIVILTWYAVKRRETGHIFLLTWLAVTLALTIPHQRFQLYMTVPVALTAAVCTAEAVRWSWEGAGDLILAKISRGTGPHNTGDLKRDTGKKERKAKKTARESGTTKPVPAIKGIIFAAVIIITALVFVTSAVQDYTYVAGTKNNVISKDWGETLAWMKVSTPPTGVDYFQEYDRQTFTYPDTSYGVLAPWEDGHRIMFFAERLPITNPFQNHLDGSTGAAAFYLTGNESTADAILAGFKGRYVVTDLGTATDTFPSLIPWVTGSDDISPYLRWFFAEDVKSSSGLVRTHLLGDDYFQSMIVRLQVFDGSLVLSGTGQYTQYTVRQVPDSGDTAGLGGLARVITGTRTVNISEDTVTVIPEGTTLSPGATYADIYSNVPYQPVKKVPALTHYRLVHESPTNLSVQLFGSATGSALPDIRLVKVFEFVKGAHIPGEGVIELTLVTNTGRTFVYRQESSGGEFVVPYATEGSATEVRATGPYHIAGTTRQIHVSEADVLNGNRVSG